MNDPTIGSVEQATLSIFPLNNGYNLHFLCYFGGHAFKILLLCLLFSFQFRFWNKPFKFTNPQLNKMIFESNSLSFMWNFNLSWCHIQRIKTDLSSSFHLTSVAILSAEFFEEFKQKCWFWVHTPSYWQIHVLLVQDFHPVIIRKVQARLLVLGLYTHTLANTPVEWCSLGSSIPSGSERIYKKFSLHHYQPGSQVLWTHCKFNLYKTFNICN